jgi:type II secretory pathway pseudopilin PulG
MRRTASSRDVSRRRPIARRAVTLLETLVALTLAVAGLSVALAAIGQSMRASQVIERSKSETALARSLVEEAFLRLLPEDERAESTETADIWRGVSPEGIPWEIEVRSTLIGAFNARSVNSDVGLGQARGVAAGQMAVDMITVRAGSIEVRTTRW